MARVEKERAEQPEAIIKPDYMKCIRISTEASLLYMIAPGLLRSEEHTSELQSP